MQVFNNLAILLFIRTGKIQEILTKRLNLFEKSGKGFSINVSLTSVSLSKNI